MSRTGALESEALRVLSLNSIQENLEKSNMESMEKSGTLFSSEEEFSEEGKFSEDLGVRREEFFSSEDLGVRREEFFSSEDLGVRREESFWDIGSLFFMD